MPAMYDRFQRKADVIHIPGKENPAKGHMLISRCFLAGFSISGGVSGFIPYTA